MVVDFGYFVLLVIEYYCKSVPSIASAKITRDPSSLCVRSDVPRGEKKGTAGADDGELMLGRSFVVRTLRQAGESRCSLLRTRLVVYEYSS